MNFELPSDLPVAARFDVCHAMSHKNPNNAIVYTNAFKNSFPGLQFENLAKKK